MCHLDCSLNERISRIGNELAEVDALRSALKDSDTHRTSLENEIGRLRHGAAGQTQELSRLRGEHSSLSDAAEELRATVLLPSDRFELFI